MTTSWTYILHWHTHVSDNVPTKRVKRDTFVRLPPLPRADTPIHLPNIPPKKHLLRRNEKPKKIQHIPSVAVAVPTHNRIGYVQLASKAFSGTFPSKDVWLFDDKSTEYTPKELMRWYETKHIFSPEKQLKADAMARHILEWFVDTDYDVLVLLDSDLIVAPNWLDSLHAGLRDSTGVLSLYRSGAPKHKSSSCGAVLCEQPSMGNAGTVWRRELAEKMLSEMSNREGGFDWGWSEWCEKKKVPMQALKASAVLHIGMHGSWSHETTQEKSVGFPMQTLSADVRHRAEHFLKGAKPTVIAPSEPKNKKLPNPNHDNKSGDKLVCPGPNFHKKKGQCDSDLLKRAFLTGCLPPVQTLDHNKWIVFMGDSNMRILFENVYGRFGKKIGLPEQPYSDRYAQDSETQTRVGFRFIPFMEDNKITKLHKAIENLSILHDDKGHPIYTSKDGSPDVVVMNTGLWEVMDIDDGDWPKFQKRLETRFRILLKNWRSKKLSRHFVWITTPSVTPTDAIRKYMMKRSRMKWLADMEFRVWKEVWPEMMFIDLWDWTDKEGYTGDYHWRGCTLQTVSNYIVRVVISLANDKSSDMHSNWQSYITSAEHSQTDIKTVAYDSRNIWAEPDTCKHASGTPERPSKLFEKWSVQICSQYPKACTIFRKAFVDTWDNGITWLKDGTVFLVTGDIPLMWLRDSSAQVTHYLALSEHSSIQRLIEGVLRRQMKWIELDVYGSAFRMFLDFDHAGKKRLTDWDFKCGRTIHVAQHDYEMDSLAYVVRLAYQYWKKTGRTCWTQNVQKTWHRIVDMWILEQDHSKSTYTYPTLDNGGKGTPVCKTGMSWAGMRPSDDKMKYHYNIPGQLFAAKALEYIEEMSALWSDDTLKQKASKLRLEMLDGVKKHGVVDGVLAYETDGCGHHLMADDANIPSLLSLPYLDIHRPEYEKTRLNILSDKNPWWSEGGIGSPHTNGRGHPWHLAMIMEGWDDKSTLERVLKTAYGDTLHESVTMSGGSTRKWFGWANALFSEWLMQSSKYIVIMPSVKRNNNQYLKKTLDTLDVTKPKDVPVLFINANKPAEKHEYLINWCNTHSEYEYVVPPMVSEELVQNAIKMDKRGDTPHFLRWRTMETSHALFGFEQALKTGAKYIIWLQDDIIVRPDMFEKLEDLDIICLQDGKNYCGAVGYLFSRKFVKNLIPKIKKNILYMPIDWIIFDLRPVLKLEQQGKPIPAGMPNRPRRIPLVHHIGIKSTKTPKKKDLDTKCHMVDLPGHVHVSPRQVPRNIIQIFPYGHEFDILKMKIQNNVEFTDEFIIIEGDKTFALERKPYYLDENINQVNHMAKIRRLKLNIRSTNKYSWDVQNEMRLSDKPIREYFTDLDENSMIVSSDLDEIIKPNVLCLLKHYDFSPMPSGVKWKKFLYGFFNEEPHVKQQWNSFGTVDETPVSIRHKDETWIFQNGGWHCSWCMQMEGIMQKLIHSPYVDLPRIADNPKFMDINVLCNYVHNGRWFLNDQFKPKSLQVSKDIPIAVPPYLLEPLDCNHRLSIIIPFREKVSDVFSQGSGREQNLKDWTDYMCSFLPKVGRSNVDVHILEQTQEGPFNKGALFNVGYHISKDTSDYMVLHDVDHIPENEENNYAYHEEPTHMCVRTSQFNYQNVHQASLGGAFMITMVDYKNINGYSNLFLGWGGEDDNFGERLGGRIRKLSPSVGRYKALDHKRTMGLDETPLFKNHPNADKTSGVSDVKWRTISSQETKCGSIKFTRTLVEIKYANAMIDMNSQSQPLIQTSDLFAAIDYNAQENSGPWKQGWDYDYDGRFKDGLTVHVVPHSHNDPGWIQTYHTYYSTQTKHILDTVVAALTEDPRRTFIWAEISYFSLWWDDASPQQKEQAKRLVTEKRLDFVTGGWVMNDEASVTARATRWHLQEGREWLKETFGVTPQYSWAIDPFGHSAGQAQVLKELGYKGMLIQRVHYAVKKQLAQKQQLEFQWQTPAGEIFTHMMPFYSYDGPHTCGPDPSVCCQFDFARIGKGKTWTGCPWGKMAVEITEHNVAERSRKWLDQVYKKAMLYRGKHVLVPVGDDFRYQTMEEAHKQFTNYQKMFDWIRVNVPAVKASFSTLTKYFDAARGTEVPRLEGSFFPYSDRVQDYWTGYFNSRIFYKGYDRLLESMIAAVEKKCPAVDIHSEKRALGLFQHHDGITGTAKSHVVQDYYQTMQKAVNQLQLKLKTCLDVSSHVVVNPLPVDTPTMKANDIRPYEEMTCVPIEHVPNQLHINEHGLIVQINETPVHESIVWRSNTPGDGKAGAYLMSVTDQQDVLSPKSHSICSTSKYKEIETVFDMAKRRIRVYNDGTIEIIYDVDIHTRNNGELWATFKPEWSAEKLCSDVHGLTWECHEEKSDAPLQAKFWPMPTMSWLSSSSARMTLTGAQPTGVGFHERAMVIMLDRRGDRDDFRGLGQGVTDSRPVHMRFGLLIEEEYSSETASESARKLRNWMLNPEIELL